MRKAGLEGVVICDCGILVHLPTAQEEQWDMDSRYHTPSCPVCKNKLKE